MDLEVCSFKCFWSLRASIRFKPCTAKQHVGSRRCCGKRYSKTVKSNTTSTCLKSEVALSSVFTLQYSFKTEFQKMWGRPLSSSFKIWLVVGLLHTIQWLAVGIVQTKLHWSPSKDIAKGVVLPTQSRGLDHRRLCGVGLMRRPLSRSPFGKTQAPSEEFNHTNIDLQVRQVLQRLMQQVMRIPWPRPFRSSS